MTDYRMCIVNADWYSNHSVMNDCHMFRFYTYEKMNDNCKLINTSESSVGPFLVT